MKYRELYQCGVTSLQEADIQDAILDARLLLEWICNTNRNDLLVHGDREVETILEEKFLKAINTRKSHIPLQYITGVQEFMGLCFEVDENVLIPRQDTEILVEEAMLLLHDGMKILDICTGSGCILLSLLHYSNDCSGVGLDISKDALKVAERNSISLNINADLRESDLTSALKLNEKFDVVVSNPPYIRTDVIQSLMPEVKTYEPFLALDGKEDGLYFYRKIVVEVKEYIARGGYLLFEIGYDQGEAVRQIMLDAGYQEVEIKKDLSGLDRVVLGTLMEDLCLTN